jgi:AmmeMemoRadiSam system radical SAM enzyme/AmmeMemoRadiSam system protein B/AmmeMemoRadiSam system protein A
MVLTTYGRSSGFCVDPIEKKPLNHFLPGTSVLSFGTAGCNLGCQFCQNWSISKSREVERLSEAALPEAIAEAALRLGCRSVAFTYNDPVIWAEYAIDVARACRAAGVRTVAVTAGYITPLARGPFFAEMDAANVDLKAFTEQFYQRLTLAHLAPVLDTLRWLRAESDVWLEVTNLVIPGANDTPDELRRLCDWMLSTLGDDVPLHFTAFHPDFRLRDRERTPHETLLEAHALARQAGLQYVYVGNVNDLAHQSTYCPQCRTVVIERDWYRLGRWSLDGNRCRHCGGVIAGRFEAAPGTWGQRRLPVRVADVARPTGARKTVAMPSLSPTQERAIHHAACVMVKAAIERRPPPLTDPALGGAAAWPTMGAFVSLKRRGRLRGCCGLFGESTTILDALSRAASRTATDDPRLPAVSATELRYLDLEVWLLEAPQPVLARGEARRDAVSVGRHGLWIRRGNASGLLLPGVAVENGLDAEGFLEQVCVKASLPPTAWKADDVQLGTFEGRAIAGPFDRAVAEGGTTRALVSRADLDRLAAHARANVAALRAGRLASCWLTGVADATVHGVSLALRLPAGDEPRRVSRLSLRPGLPLQSTLYELCETAATTFPAADGARLELTVLADPAMHGTVADPDLGGLDPATRAVLVLEAGKTAWRWDPREPAESLLAWTAREAQVRSPAGALVLSLAALSTESAASAADTPRPRPGTSTRPAAVAGAFYPEDPGDLARVVDGLVPATPVTPEAWPAIMVPHAGLRYSGRIAAAVYARVHIPDVVIVLAPRHHRLGVEWAVAPHDTWAIPGARVASDPTLARELAEAIPGLQLDSVAHQREHSIEVQLPLLARLAPHARVVGIALGAGDLERCRQLGAGLAEVLRARRERPLLVISTDLNHYASDAENRRLDALALDALERLDPAELWRTTQTHRISMCGLLPALVVLETLRRLDRLRTARRVGYATSADATGDTRRVVGYGGMLFG